MTSRAEALRAQHAADGDATAAAARRAEMRALHAGGGVLSANDKVAAVVVLMDSEEVADVQLAQDLALAVMAQRPSTRPLAAFAFDRLRMLAGRPQKFGTQVVVRDGARELWTMEPGTTDSERAKWGLPPLAELLRAAVTGSSPPWAG